MAKAREEKRETSLGKRRKNPKENARIATSTYWSQDHSIAKT